MPIHVMIKNRITWSLMITILLDPKQTGSSSRRTHRVRKFQVPEYVVELLVGLPFVVGCGIRVDFLALRTHSALWLGGS